MAESQLVSIVAIRTGANGRGEMGRIQIDLATLLQTARPRGSSELRGPGETKPPHCPGDTPVLVLVELGEVQFIVAEDGQHRYGKIIKAGKYILLCDHAPAVAPSGAKHNFSGHASVTGGEGASVQVYDLPERINLELEQFGWTPLTYDE